MSDPESCLNSQSSDELKFARHLDLMIGTLNQPLTTWELPLGFLGHNIEQFGPTVEDHCLDLKNDKTAFFENVVANRDSAAEFTAYRLADHRAEYLDYQGPISNERGFVKQVARGLVGVSDFSVREPTETKPQFSGFLAEFKSPSLNAQLTLAQQSIPSEIREPIHQNWTDQNTSDPDPVANGLNSLPFPMMEKNYTHRRGSEWRFYLEM